MVSVSPEENLASSLQNLCLPQSDSHKGQNGKLLVIGGSQAFHAASIWAAAAASKIVDMVHYSSTQENAKVFLHLKSHFLDGIVIRQNQLLSYVEEDDCILIGPGMERGAVSPKTRDKEFSFEEICALNDEADYTYALIRFLMHTYPEKKFVCDAAALHMMDLQWLRGLKKQPILTPHCREFEALFAASICDAPLEEKKLRVMDAAKKSNAVILFKQVVDIIADGNICSVVTGGNAGLTKGGSGDVLAGITAALYTTNDAQLSALLASFLVKKSAEDMFATSGLLYNTSDLIRQLPLSAKPILFDN